MFAPDRLPVPDARRLSTAASELLLFITMVLAPSVVVSAPYRSTCALQPTGRQVQQFIHPNHTLRDLGLARW
jgi:hypothetical protein